MMKKRMEAMTTRMRWEILKLHMALSRPMTLKVLEKRSRGDGRYIETVQNEKGEIFYRSCGGGTCRYSSDFWQAEIYLEYFKPEIHDA